MITINPKLKLISSYRNGNYTVRMYEDGTKVRTFIKNPSPKFPESIDIKITNNCDGGCGYCHENSVVIEKEDNHVGKLPELVKDLPAGVELALGGGNPLTVWGLEWKLENLKNQGLLVNMTVNHKHLTDEVLEDLKERSLIKGLGISYNPSLGMDFVKNIDSNTVIHVIAGVHKIEAVEALMNEIEAQGKKPKILILGFKTVGRGIKYKESLNDRVETVLSEWYVGLLPLISRFPKSIISFDNLAIEQLKVRRLFTQEDWEMLYMGNDGEFTMYIDLTTETYAVSSTAKERFPFEGKSLKQMFKHVRSLSVV